MKAMVPIAVIFASALGLSAQDVPSEALVKYVKLLLTSTGQSGFSCGSNMSLKFKLQSMGVSTAPTSKLAWASSEAQVKTLQADKRLVVVPQLAWLKLGGSVAIIQENGQPVMYVHPANVKTSGLTLSDEVMKTAKIAK